MSFGVEMSGVLHRRRDVDYMTTCSVVEAILPLLAAITTIAGSAVLYFGLRL